MHGRVKRVKSCQRDPLSAAADADGAADFHAGVRALELDEARAIFGARIFRRAPLELVLFTGRLGLRMSRGCSASTTEHSGARMIARTFFASRLLPRGGGRGYRHEFDADRLAAAPHHFAGPAVARVARECQPQLRRQRVGILDRDLGARGRQVLHHAGPRRKAALERDPAGLAQRFARLALLGVKAMPVIP